MTRIDLPLPEDMDADQRAQYDRFPSNLTRTLVLAETRLARALPETANALRSSGLDPAWREAVILRVAALLSSAYERMQHLGQAQAAGWSQEDITAIESGSASALPGELAKILPFVDACVLGTHVSDDTLREARTVLSDRDLVTVILLVGHYTTVARLTGILDVDLDPQPDSWTSEH